MSNKSDDGDGCLAVIWLFMLFMLSIMIMGTINRVVRLENEIDRLDVLEHHREHEYLEKSKYGGE